MLTHLARSASEDPGSLFIKTVKTTSKDVAHNQTTFYEAWKLTIQRYGIFNPYTGRGVIKGSLPRTDHIMSGMCSRPISSTKPGRTNRQAMQSRTHQTWSPNTMVVASHKTKPRWRRRS